MHIEQLRGRADEIEIRLEGPPVASSLTVRHGSTNTPVALRHPAMTQV
jgi:hypothetical protein